MNNVKRKAIIECRSCGSRLHVELWTQLLVGEDRAIDNQIYNDDINFFECRKCGLNGFVCYPVKIFHRESGSVATLLPACSFGFKVAQVGASKKQKVIYDFEELKWQICYWQGTHAVFDPPPAENDIKEALEKGFLNSKEAEILRHTDWESIYEEIEWKEEDSKCVETGWNEDQKEVVDLYFRFMSQLNLSRKVVPLHG